MPGEFRRDRIWANDGMASGERGSGDPASCLAGLSDSISRAEWWHGHERKENQDGGDAFSADEQNTLVG